MKKTMLLLTLLYSVHAFAANDFCENGCTLQEIEAKNKANYKTHEEWVIHNEALEAEEYRQWVQEHREAQARADALPKSVYVPGTQYRTCVQDVYEQAASFLGEDANTQISVSQDIDEKCTFDVTRFDDLSHACENLSALSAIARMKSHQEETCRYEKEKWRLYEQYRDVVYTPAWTHSVELEYLNKLKPIEQKHFDNVIKSNEQEKQTNNNNEVSQ